MLERKKERSNTISLSAEYLEADSLQALSLALLCEEEKEKKGLDMEPARSGPGPQHPSPAPARWTSLGSQSFRMFRIRNHDEVNLRRSEYWKSLDPLNNEHECQNETHWFDLRWICTTFVVLGMIKGKFEI